MNKLDITNKIDDISMALSAMQYMFRGISRIIWRPSREKRIDLLPCSGPLTMKSKI